ncbi:Protein oar [Saliniradius amylolyticus]|uniref:Protein oar n=1 Tax=Saliniradius amylolyticus TaxID=2183582 RepID=A0A2S2E5G4_9ALTE|nr:TonB-dependent receptor [Saliniradius amylolyticus]AWL12839.1 Protein oar [Saliniradius amylolyticus]
MKSNAFRRSLISLALTGALGLSAGTAMAANNDGSLTGTVSEGGATITLINEKNGMTRTITADADGNFRFPRLPIGTYDVKASKEGYNTAKADDVKVSIGKQSDVTLTLEQGNVEVISVTGGRYQMIDTASSETGINIDALDLERIPVGRSVASVANLSTSVQTGGFGGISFGGASVSHNAVFINGLNVTDVERGIGFNSVPFSFYEEFQVKTGGYSVEFGRTTGGVINAVTKSGGNDFEFGADVYYTPDALRAEQKNIYWSNGDVRFNRSEDESDSYTLSLSASGPIIEDTLFFYAMYEPRNVDSTDIGGQQNEDRDESEDDSGFWGAKLDWQISDDHLMELLAFSDEQETLTDVYRDGEFQSTDFFSTGGTNYSLTYTAYLTDNFTAKALVGQSEFEYSYGGSTDPFCNRVFDTRNDLNEHIGCSENSLFDERVSTRDAFRLDFEWFVGDHLIRFGMDNEDRETDFSRRVPGPDYQRYTLHDVTPGTVFDGVLIPDGVTQEATVYKRRNKTIARQDTKAAYIEDVWSINDDMTLTAGLRWDAFKMYQGDGSTFFEIDDMIAPRVGFSWDVNGDGQSKFFAHAGRYYQPMSLAVAARAAGNSEFRISNYVLEGLETEEVNGLTNVIPILGEELDYVDFSSSAGLGPGDVDQDVEATFQNEFILGYEMMLSEKWSAGVRAIHRDYRNAFEDMYVDVMPGDHPALPSECGNIWGWFFGNPGRDLQLQLDCGNGPQDVTIPLGEATDSWNSLSGEVIGGDQPRRLYNAVELELDRAWDDKWTANFAYTWSNSYGNFSGGGLARTGNDIPGFTEIADDVSILNTNWGKLPNHLPHNFKVRGAYQIDDNWRVGAVFTAEAGKPINAVSSSNPYTGANANAQTHYQCVSNCSDLDNAEWIHIPNGFYGDLGWFTRLDVNVSYETEVNGADVRLGLDIFNLLDSQSVTSVVTDIDDGTVGDVDSEFMMPNGTASPRYVRLSASVRF